MEVQYVNGPLGKAGKQPFPPEKNDYEETLSVGGKKVAAKFRYAEPEQSESRGCLVSRYTRVQ